MQSLCLRQTIAGVGKSFFKDLTDGDIEIEGGTCKPESLFTMTSAGR
jgi:hypothetical protein